MWDNERECLIVRLFRNLLLWNGVPTRSANRCRAVSAENNDLLHGPLPACLSIGRLGGREVDTDMLMRECGRPTGARMRKPCLLVKEESDVSRRITFRGNCWKAETENLPEWEGPCLKRRLRHCSVDLYGVRRRAFMN